MRSLIGFLLLSQLYAGFFLIEVYSPDCYYCKEMEKIFKDKDVKVILEKMNFRKINIDKEKLPEKLKSKFPGIIPTFFIVDEKMNVKKVIPGSWDKKDFLELIKYKSKEK